MFLLLPDVREVGLGQFGTTLFACVPTSTNRRFKEGVQMPCSLLWTKNRNSCPEVSLYCLYKIKPKYWVGWNTCAGVDCGGKMHQGYIIRKSHHFCFPFTFNASAKRKEISLSDSIWKRTYFSVLNSRQFFFPQMTKCMVPEPYS